MRAFIGVKLNDCFNKIVNEMDELTKIGVSGNFTNPNNIHLTLEFLGEIENSDFDKIKVIFNNLKFRSFKVSVTKLTNLRDMIICEVDKSEALMDLQKMLHETLLKNKFILESRPYYPHLTLVRKSNKKVQKQLNMQSVITEVILFSSERINNELTYRPILTKKLEDNYA